MARLLIGPLLNLLTRLFGPLMAFFAGKQHERAKDAEDALKGAERGRQGAQRARDAIKDGKTPEDIVRDNDGSWS